MIHFNSQPHEEADTGYAYRHYILIISTHSLTKRLTFATFFFCYFYFISTHSLTKRLTAGKARFFPGCEHFNSQPHEEADSSRSVHKRRRSISTHSLTKRLTSDDASEVIYQKVFQLTASRRGWRGARISITYQLNISTHSLTKRLTAYTF